MNLRIEGYETAALSHQCKVQASLRTMQAVAAAPGFRLSSDEQLLFTMAKAYYRGGGWWLISGYSHNGSDVIRVADRLAALADLEQDDPAPGVAPYGGRYWE